jgi:membrane fusion protein (multidrug efflux system)
MIETSSSFYPFMNDELSSSHQSITPPLPEVITLSEDPTPPRHPVLIWILAVVVMLLFLAGLAAFRTHQISQAIAKGKAFQMPPDAITSMTISEKSISPVLEAVGSISSPQGVVISADLPGVVTEILFTSGTLATNGQILVKLDTRQEDAQLNSAKARLSLFRQNVERSEVLSEKRVIAQSAFDESKSAYEAGVASLAEMQAAIDRKTLRAPFAGTLGIRQINIGQYLKSGEPIVALESLDTMYVNFALPQQYIGNLHVGQAIRMQADGLPEKAFEGSITAINSLVDTSTRNIQIQGTIPNPEHLLRSGMFAAVQVLLPRKSGVLMIPATSIQYAPYGDSVFVIETMKDASGKEYLGVREQPVVLGKTQGDQIEIVKGLHPGQQIATSGTFKLRQGGAVKCNNSVQPGNNPAPRPEDS